MYTFIGEHLKISSVCRSPDVCLSGHVFESYHCMVQCCVLEQDPFPSLLRTGKLRKLLGITENLLTGM